MFTQRSGRVVASAILLIPIVDELLARTASGRATLSSSANTERLSSRSSNTASMTRSARDTASDQVGGIVARGPAPSRPRPRSSFPFSTRRIRWPRFEARAFSSCSSALVVEDHLHTVERCLLSNLSPHAARTDDCEPHESTSSLAGEVGARAPGGGTGLASLNGKDPRDAIERRDAAASRRSSACPGPASTRSPPNLVVVDRQTQRPDLQVAQAHDRLGVGANRDLPPGLEPVVNGRGVRNRRPASRPHRYR